MPGPFMFEDNLGEQLIRAIEGAGESAYLESSYRTQQAILTGLSKLEDDPVRKSVNKSEAARYGQLVDAAAARKVEFRNRVQFLLTRLTAMAADRAVDPAVSDRYRDLVIESLALVELAGDAAGVEAKIASQPIGRGLVSDTVQASTSKLLTLENIVNDIKFFEPGTSVVARKIPGVKAILRNLTGILQDADRRPAPTAEIAGPGGTKVTISGSEAIQELMTRQQTQLRKINQEVRQRTEAAGVPIGSFTRQAFETRIALTEAPAAVTLSQKRMDLLLKRSEAIKEGKRSGRPVEPSELGARILEQIRAVEARVTRVIECMPRGRR